MRALVVARRKRKDQKRGLVLCRCFSTRVALCVYAVKCCYMVAFSLFLNITLALWVIRCQNKDSYVFR